MPFLNGLGQVEAWARQAALRGSRLPAALQVDSGMSRLGLSPEDVEALARDLDLLRMFDLRLVMSHLACADEPGHPSNHEQLHAFQRLCALLPPAPTSLANSGGVMLGASFGHDLVRPGLALYGVSPTIAGDEGLRPVVRLDARVIQVRSVPVGTAVGYGGAWRAPSDARLATVAVGYADGWPRALGGVGAAFWRGLRLPIAGCVSMDSMTLDVSALPEGTLRLGLVVELIGPQQSLDEVAAQAGTIPYKILTRLGSRFARTYPGADGPQTAPEVRLT